MAATITPTARKASATFTRFAWGVLAWNVLVVLWGAYVRASGSGAGCGSHWPLCNGEVVPVAPRVATIIEFTHRAMSGVAGLVVVALWLWTRLRFERGAPVRKAATASLIFLITEALLGAALVKFHLVEQDQSVGRVIALSLHLLNTLVLLGTLALTAWLSRDTAATAGRLSPWALAALPAAAAIGITGAIAALGDTLFPAASLAQGFRQDFAPAAGIAAVSFLVRLRVLHPVLAILAACYFVTVSVLVLRRTRAPITRRLAAGVLILTLTQLTAGAINLVLLAPVWMQLIHLFLADLVWISLVLLTVEAKLQ